MATRKQWHRRKVTVGGREWTIRNRPPANASCLGWHDHANRTIELHPCLVSKPREFLITAMHELLHVECPEWSEARVERVAAEFVRALWRLPGGLAGAGGGGSNR